jgi:hypothetical protein
MRASLILACGCVLPPLMCGCASDRGEFSPLDPGVRESAAIGGDDEVMTEVALACPWHAVAEALGIVGDTVPRNIDIVSMASGRPGLAITYLQAPPTFQADGVWLVVRRTLSWTQVSRCLCIAGRTLPTVAEVSRDGKTWLVLLKYCVAPPVRQGEVVAEDRS